MVKIDYFTKNVCPTLFLQIITWNLQEFFLAMFRKFYQENVKNLKNKSFITKI